MDVLKQLLGRLHPLIVHLPIGFIILGLLLQWLDRKKKEFSKVISLVYYWGGIAAIAACITGYLQYLGEGYAFDTVKWHLWSGIATALFSFLMFAKLKKLKTVQFLSKVSILPMSILFLVLISFTGHQGANITHGEEYLLEPLPNSIKSALGLETYEKKEIVLLEENWEEAMLYEDVIKPILANNCISCHGPKKTKADLALHTPEGIRKGGENGEIIDSDKPQESQLFSRLILPKEDEDHMPPKEKTQPTREEIKIIETWIAEGSPFDKTIGELGLRKDIFLSYFPVKMDNDFPDIEIATASIDSIQRIEKKGIHIDEISKTTNFLRVSCINKPTFSDEDFELLLPIGRQIAILDLGGTKVTDAIFERLSSLPHLTVLKLDNTEVSGATINLLAKLEYLKSINLTQTKFEEAHLKAFSGFQSLRKVYLYKTLIGTQGIRTMNDGKIVIDYGEYELPRLASDTIVY